MEAAAKRFEDRGLSGLSLSAVARGAGLTKSNLYTYFDSVEHVMLTLILDDWTRFAADLETRLGAVCEPVPRGDVAAVIPVAEAWCQAAMAHPRYCSLMSVLASVIEKNVSLETLMEFKRETRGLVLRHVNALNAALPALGIQRSREILPPLFGILAGLWPYTTPGEAMLELRELPEFSNEALDVPAELRRGVELILRGALAAEADS